MNTTDIKEIEEHEMTPFEVRLAQAILGALEYRGFYDCGKYLDTSFIEHVRPLFQEELDKAVEVAKLEQAEFEMKLLEAHINLITEDKIWTDSVYNYIDGRLQALTSTKTDKQ